MDSFRSLPKNESKMEINRVSNSTRNIKGAIIHMQLNMHELKKQLSSMTTFPEILSEMEFEFKTYIVQLCQHYQTILNDFRANNIRLELLLEQSKQNNLIERNKAADDLERRDDLINKLLEKISILEQCHKYKEKDKYSHMSEEIDNLRMNNQELVTVVERYKRHITQLEGKRKSLEYREKEGFVSLEKRNRFLLDRYLKEKRENQSLQSHFNSLDKDSPKRLGGKSTVYNSPVTIKNQQTLRTQCSPVNQYHPHHKSHSRDNENHQQYKPTNRKSIHLYTKNYVPPSNPKSHSKQRQQHTLPNLSPTQKLNARHYKPTNLSHFLSSIRPT